MTGRDRSRLGQGVMCVNLYIVTRTVPKLRHAQDENAALLPFD